MNTIEVQPIKYIRKSWHVYRKTHAEIFEYVKDWMERHESIIGDVSIKIETNGVEWGARFNYKLIDEE